METRSIFCDMLQGASKVDADQRCVVVNEAYAIAFSRKPNELVGVDWKSILSPDDFEAACHAYHDMFVTSFGELRAHSPSRDHNLSPKCILLVKKFDQDKVFCGHFCFLLDPVDKNQGDQALRQGDLIFRTALQQAPVGGVLIGANGKFTRVNSTLCNMLDYSERELSNKSFADLIHPQDFEKGASLPYMVVAGTVGGYQLEKRLLSKDGQPYLANLSVKVIRDLQRRPLYAIGIIQGLSANPEARHVRELAIVAARDRAEKSLRQVQERYSAVAEQAWEGIVLIDPASMKIIEATRSFLQLVGYGRAEIADLTLYDLVADEREIIQRAMEPVIANLRYAWGNFHSAARTVRSLIWT